MESPSEISPDKYCEFPREPMSPQESIELRVEGMRMLRENLASELVAGIQNCSHQVWAAHDRLTAGIRDCIGVIVESLAEMNTRNLHDYYSKNVIVSKMSRSDVEGEVGMDCVIENRVQTY